MYWQYRKLSLKLSLVTDLATERAAL